MLPLLSAVNRLLALEHDALADDDGAGAAALPGWAQAIKAGLEDATRHPNVTIFFIQLSLNLFDVRGEGAAAASCCY